MLAGACHPSQDGRCQELFALEFEYEGWGWKISKYMRVGFAWSSFFPV